MEKKYSEITNPATGEVIGKSILNEPGEIKKIISDARAAQLKWFALGTSKRIKIIKRVRNILVEQADEIADIISKDNGKVKVDAIATEVVPATMAVSYYCKHAKTFLKDRSLNAGNVFLINKRSKIVRAPYGVVGIISPWNYPFTIPFSEIVMGLLAGNAIVLKTASETQLVGLKLKEIFESVGLPENVFNYINMPGKIAGDLLLENGIDKLFFTGSVAVGKYLMEKAAKNLTSLVLELGGNDPMIVCEDADPFRSAMGALWAGFQNSGQSCGGVERIYVHEKVYDKFITILNDKINNLVLGVGDSFDSQMGCITTERQINTIKTHVNEAVKKGGVILAQSKLPGDKNLKNFFPAMVIGNVNHDMLLMKDETFGPVVGVMKFNNYNEAIKMANDSYLGLTASVWSKSRKRAENIARQIKAGAVTINDHLMSHGLAETPWGGFKQSGIGRTHGKVGFDEMTQPQVLVADLLSSMKKNLWWHPYNEKVYNGLKGLILLLYSKSLAKKMGGSIKLLKILPRMLSKNK